MTKARRRQYSIIKQSDRENNIIINIPFHSILVKESGICLEKKIQMILFTNFVPAFLVGENKIKQYKVGTRTGIMKTTSKDIKLTKKQNMFFCD